MSRVRGHIGIGRTAGRYHRHADATTSTAGTGPRDCLRTVQPPATCPACSTPMVTVRHVPIKMAGTYCRACCPCCANGTDQQPADGVTP